MKVPLSSQRRRFSLGAVLGAASLLMGVVASPAIAAPLPDSGPEAGATSVEIATDLSFTLVEACTSGGVALDSDGHLYQWGASWGNTSGIPTQLDRGELPADATVVSVSCAYNSAILLTDAGDAYAWGANASGQLGNGTTTNAATPVRVADGDRPAGVTFTSISTGGALTGPNIPVVAALGSDGHIYTWGSNALGQVGDGTLTNSTEPRLVTGGEIPSDAVFTQVISNFGGAGVYALSAEGDVYSWGIGGMGQLGNGSSSNAGTPVKVAFPAGVEIQQIGSSLHGGFALSTSGEFYVWGSQSQGALGDGVNQTSGVATPKLLDLSFTGGSDIVDFDGGWYSGWMQLADGRVFWWGNNDYGESGTGIRGDHTTPQQLQPGAVPEGVVLQRISTGSTTSMAVGSDGKIYGWGNQGYGNLSNGSGASGRVETPALNLHFEISDVLFDGAAGGDLAVTDSGASVTTPPHAAGPVDVTVVATVVAGAVDAGFPHEETYVGGFTYLAPAVPPIITTDKLESGVVGATYESTVDATGTGPIEFTISEGELPAGLFLDPVTGVISGVPEVPGTYTFTVTATNEAGSDSREYVIEVGAAPSITTESLPSGTTGSEYGSAVNAEGSGPITYEVTEGNLPPGLSLDPATGEISGTPTTPGEYVFSVTASNAFGEDTREYVIIVAPVSTPGVEDPGVDEPGVDDPGVDDPGSENPGAPSDSDVATGDDALNLVDGDELPARTGSTGSLAITGGELPWGVPLGAGILVLGGGIAVLWSRRRLASTR